MQSIQRGSLVRLVSGGPVMTIQGFSNSRDVALCAWFEGATLRSEPLVTASLVSVPGADARGLHSPAPLVPPRTQLTVELP